jgi:hypothetical protein
MQFFLLLSFLSYSAAFLPRFSTQVQTILSSKAIVSGFMATVTEEFWSNNILFRELLLNHRYTSMDIVYLSLLVATLYNKTLLSGQSDKLKNLDFYAKVEKNTKVVLLVLMIIFNRNVENAI